MQNADLIKSLPRDIARDVNAMILQWTMEGLRAEEIAAKLKEKVPQGVTTNLQLIARTELSKANSAITQARCQEMDIQWYTWQTAKDGDRVRPSHRHMQGVLVPWDSPPNPEALLGIRSPFGNYHAGGCPNCRCYAEPVVAIELLPESFKVYTGGGIETINRAEFQRMIAA
jgi:SPP1 gp7 family putative phage head morphogenesis protein